jgi:methyl-accepting chemotaxis protein
MRVTTNFKLLKTFFQDCVMLKNIRVVAKLLVLLAIPTAALIAFSIDYAFEKYREMRAVGVAVEIVDFSSAGSGYIHELQKERGLSAGFTASKGNAFAAELRAQRQESNALRKSLQEKMDAFTAGNPAAKLNNAFAPLLRRLDEMDGVRGRIDGLSLPAAQVIAEYTATIRQLQDILGGILEYCQGLDMYGKASDLLSFIGAKEFAGQERATLNGAFSAGVFNKASYRSWIERISLQNEHLNLALQDASPGVKEQYARRVGPLRDKVEEFRRQAYENVDKPSLGGDAKAWFAASTAYIDELRTVETAMGGELEDMARSMADAARRNFYVSLGALIAALCFTCFLAWRIVRDITGALDRTVTFAQSVAAGELGTGLVMDRADEFGVLIRALNAMLAAIKDMIGKADAATESARKEADKAQEATREAQQARMAESAKRDGMVNVAERINAVVTVLSSASRTIFGQLTQSDKGAHAQSEHLAAAAKAMEAMTAMMADVEKSSAGALAVADDARKQAQKGAEKVGDVDRHISQLLDRTKTLKEAMSRLDTRVQDIDKVLTVISDIADQTNLLALNAAIEAARAGEAGRGFAVVADEVRKLAEKTMNATKEVGEVLSGIQRDTEHNVASVDATVDEMMATTGLTKESGEALQSIVRLSDTTRDQIGSIAAASAEQSAASKDVNRGVEDVNRIAVDTVTSMDECTKGMHVLLEQVKELDSLIEVLRAG